MESWQRSKRPQILKNVDCDKALTSPGLSEGDFLSLADSVVDKCVLADTAR